ncbi:hypothetical protein AGR7C_pTi0058 [Agrobacterium deltaense Zutra 3/1]|uniref:Uncharacterized protein n=1 Tax=Agrobacterium deltaense Zutra 3/1 TaxID=1183427 RepID=A0A1S7S5C6_9HYPH|nr:hypothetical protein AGR7C_pTi0058 [Agrobacterium deltaense Zutra 3/1]
MLFKTQFWERISISIITFPAKRTISH